VLCEDVGDGVHVERRIADAIRAEPFRIGDRDFSLTASVGTATSPPGPSGAEELVAAADAAMYLTKTRP
jgi:GGDEF domain-containing protein